MADRSAHPAPARRARSWELSHAIAPDAEPAREEVARRLLASLLARRISTATARRLVDAPHRGTGQGGGVGAAANEPAAQSPGPFAAAPAPSLDAAADRTDAGGAA